MTDDKAFEACSRIWRGTEEALLRILEDIPDRESWDALRHMARRTDSNLDWKLLFFSLTHHSVKAEEDFPGQKFLAERKAKRLAAVEEPLPEISPLPLLGVGFLLRKSVRAVNRHPPGSTRAGLVSTRRDRKLLGL